MAAGSNDGGAGGFGGVEGRRGPLVRGGSGGRQRSQRYPKPRPLRANGKYERFLDAVIAANWL
jgi:hypothetical protein